MCIIITEDKLFCEVQVIQLLVPLVYEVIFIVFFFELAPSLLVTLQVKTFLILTLEAFLLQSFAIMRSITLSSVN